MFKKATFFISFIFILLLTFFYKENEPEISSTEPRDREERERHFGVTTKVAKKKSLQLHLKFRKKLKAKSKGKLKGKWQGKENNKEERRQPSSIKAAQPYTIKKIKDYSALPPRYTSNRPLREKKSFIKNHLKKMKEKYINTKLNYHELETSAGDFYISNNLMAVLKSSFTSTQGQKVLELNQYIVYKKEDLEPAQAISVDNHHSQKMHNLKSFDPKGPSLISINKSSGKMGILTGTIVLELLPNYLIEEISLNSKFNIIYRAESIHTYFLKLSETDNLTKLVENLRKNKLVKRADFEIIESLNKSL